MGFIAKVADIQQSHRILQNISAYGISHKYHDDVFKWNYFSRYWPLWGESVGFPSQWPVTRSFDVFFGLGLNKRLGKQSKRRWFEKSSRSLWRHCNVFSPMAIHCQSDHHEQSLQCRPGPRFTNGFSIAIQIRWKFRFTLISILIQWSLQNFVHGTTAMLSWHVQKFVAIWWPATELQQGEVSIEFELRQKIVSETDMVFKMVDILSRPRFV